MPSTTSFGRIQTELRQSRQVAYSGAQEWQASKLKNQSFRAETLTTTPERKIMTASEVAVALTIRDESLQELERARRNTAKPALKTPKFISRWVVGSPIFAAR